MNFLLLAIAAIFIIQGYAFYIDGHQPKRFDERFNRDLTKEPDDIF